MKGRNGPVPDMINSAGTVRRMRALIACGHPPVVLAARLGMTRQQFTNMMARRYVTPAEAAAVRGLYTVLCHQPPDLSTVAARRAAGKARGYAARHNFAPPAAWDEDEDDPYWIDNPDAGPAPGSWPWRPQAYSALELAREVQFLLKHGCSADDIAGRLGYAVSTINDRARTCAA